MSNIFVPFNSKYKSIKSGLNFCLTVGTLEVCEMKSPFYHQVIDCPKAYLLANCGGLITILPVFKVSWYVFDFSKDCALLVYFVSDRWDFIHHDTIIGLIIYYGISILASSLAIRVCRREEIFSKSLAWVFFWCLFMYRSDLKNLKNLG